MKGDDAKKTKTKKKKKRRRRSSNNDDDNVSSLVPLLLASSLSLSSSSNSTLLCRLLLSRMRRSPHPIPPSLLALAPLLLLSSPSSPSPSPSVPALTAQLLGAASLQSLHHNQTIASDPAILHALVKLLATATPRKTLAAVLTALTDLSASSFARHRLTHLHAALHNLLCLLCQEMEMEMVMIMSHKPNNNKLCASILHLALLLINTSPLSFSHKHPHGLILKALPFFSKIHHKAAAPATAAAASLYSKIHQLCTLSNQLPETIFRLSVHLPDPTFHSQDLRSYLFGTHQSDFQAFLLNSWENSPLLLKKGSKFSDPIFGSLLNFVNPKSTASIVDSILQCSVTCPAVVSDELDLNQTFNEINCSLGSPLVYNQDIRIVKTEGHSYKKEHHFPFVDKCKEAFDSGYSIALKGMECRSDQIAPCSLSLSELFGLPSIGVNLYLSPPGAQGLARHYDDHCVLVWQITGCKLWTILKEPKPIFPRLYESLDNTCANEKEGETEILLEEGDILYIPRGYFHEARTVINGSGSLKIDCSLHLTFAIEVERPFEWEGFMHVTLHCWREKLIKTSDNMVLNLNSNFETITHLLLLHVAIKLISDQTPAFWKACMVASNFKMDNHKLTFDHLMNIIYEKSNFMEAFNWVKLVVEKREEDSVQCMRWLRNVYDDIDYDNMLEILEKHVVVVCCGKSEEAMGEFSLFKSRFCQSAVYEDACARFRSLLEKYRIARKQYMKGMLSLHRKY